MKMRETLSPCEREPLDFTEASPEGKYMLDKVAKKLNTRLIYARGCKFFSEYLKKSLTEIVQEYQKDIKANAYEGFDKWEKILEDFTLHLQETLKYSSSSANIYFSGAKNLINANVPRSLRLQVKGPSVTSRTIPGVTYEDLKEIYNMSDVRERAIISFLKDSGMSKADFVILNISDIEDFEKTEFVHLNVYRGKESVEYETFIGPNAVQDLRAYFAVRTQRGEKLTSDSPLFVTDYHPYHRLDEDAISSTFILIEENTGKVISSHRLRKFFETYMALVVRHPIILKYWMGHRIKKGRDIEAKYIIPPTPEQLKLYKESYHNIDLTGGTLEEKAKQAAKEQFESMLTLEQKDLIRKSGLKLARKTDTQRETQAKEKEACTNGKHCGEDFKQINESELLTHLNAGWEIVHNLQNGQVIVKNTRAP